MKPFTAFFFLVILCFPLTGWAAGHIVSPHDFQPIRAVIINSDPENFTIDVHNLSNWGADEDAPAFAIYVSGKPPEQCADFSDLELDYRKPTEHQREFDLSEHREVLEAIEAYQCVVVKNIPSPSQPEKHEYKHGNYGNE